MLEGLGTALVGAGTIGNLYQGYLNYKQDKKKLSWDKDVQRTTWLREDNAHQRAVSDLEAAGLSKTLAAGKGAGAGAVVQTKAPNLELPINETIMLGAQLQKMDNDIAKTQEETKLAKLQQDQTIANTLKANAEAGIKSHDLGIFRKSGLPSNSSAIGKIVKDAIGFSDVNVKNVVKKAKNEAVDLFSTKGRISKEDRNLSERLKNAKSKKERMEIMRNFYKNKAKQRRKK